MQTQIVRTIHAPSSASAKPRASRLDWAPGLKTLRDYQLSWLRNDLVAGVVLSTILVPVGIALAVASGLPAITGLYATIIPLIAYGIFGPSRLLILGPDSSLAPIILGVVLPLSGGDPSRALGLAGAMAIVAGLACMLGGFARLGFIDELLSKPIRYGYMNGIALAVLVSQLPELFGISIKSSGPLRDLWAIGSAIAAGKANWAGTIVGAGTLVLILALKAHKRMGAILVAVILAILATDWFDLPQRFGVKVLGPVPQGLPQFAVPWVHSGDIPKIIEGGLAIALVAFADTSVLSRTFAARAGARVDPNREMVALGAANLAAAFFHGFAISSSSSRTAVAAAAGAKTQLTGVIGALVVGLVILVAPTVFRDLPYSALAAVVITAGLGLAEFKDLARIQRIQEGEFWLCIVCTAAVAVFGAIPGIGLAVAIAILEFLWDAWRPHRAILGKPKGVEGYHDVARYPQAKRTPGLVLFRWDAPLFFANAQLFSDCVLDAIAESPTPVRRVVVAAEPITNIDLTSADALSELDSTLEDRGVELCFAELKDPVKDKLKQFGLFAEFGESRFFPTTESAVRAYLETEANNV